MYTQFTISSHYIHNMYMYMWYIHTVQYGIARPFIQVIDYTLFTVQNKISQDISGYLRISLDIPCHLLICVDTSCTVS